MCEKRGFPCGPKVLGPKAQARKAHWEVVDIELDQSVVPISRPTPTPDDMLLTTADVQYLQYLWNDMFYGPSRSAVYGGWVYLSWIGIPLHRALFPIPSKSLRYAILALSSAVKTGKSSVDSLTYLGLFYKYARAAIESSAYVDIIYSSYVVVDRALRFQEPLDTIVCHVFGIFKCLTNPDATDGLPEEEKLWVQRMWHKVLARVYFHLRDQPNQNPSILASFVENICEMLESHWPTVLSSLPSAEKLSHKELYHLTVALEVHLNYHFLRFLLAVNIYREQRRVEHASALLKQVLHRIISLLGDKVQSPIQSCPLREKRSGDISTVFDSVNDVYFSALVIQSTLIYPVTSNHNDPKRSLATKLCQACQSPRFVHESRNEPNWGYTVLFMFLMGLILTNSHYLKGCLIGCFTANV